MADPIVVTLISAFIAGAAKGVAETAVRDAYSGLKQLVMTGYGHVVDLVDAVAKFEARPESDGRRTSLEEELVAANALDDEKLIAAAEAVLKAAEPVGMAIGVDWSDVRAASLKIDEIRARAGAIGFRAARLEITGDVHIGKIDVGGPLGN